MRVPHLLTLTAPAVLIYIISRWTDAGVRTGDVDTSVLTQKLRETALIQVCTKQETELTPIRKGHQHQQCSVFKFNQARLNMSE